MKKTVSAFFFIINSFFVSCQKRDYFSENRMKSEQPTNQNLDPNQISVTINNNNSSSSSSNRCCRCFCKSCICLVLILGISIAVVIMGQYLGWFDIKAFPFNQIPEHQ